MSRNLRYLAGRPARPESLFQRDADEFLHELAGLGVIQTDDAVEAGRGDGLAVRAPRHRVDRALLPFQGGDALAVIDLVNAGLPLAVGARSGDEALGVGAEVEGEDPAGHRLELADLVGVVADDPL